MSSPSISVIFENLIALRSWLSGWAWITRLTDRPCWPGRAFTAGRALRACYALNPLITSIAITTLNPLRACHALDSGVPFRSRIAGFALRPGYAWNAGESSWAFSTGWALARPSRLECRSFLLAPSLHGLSPVRSPSGTAGHAPPILYP